MHLLSKNESLLQTVHLSANMKSPYIVIPEYGTLHRGGNVVVLDLGKLKIESELQPKNLSMKVDSTLSFLRPAVIRHFGVLKEKKHFLSSGVDDV